MDTVCEEAYFRHGKLFYDTVIIITITITIVVVIVYLSIILLFIIIVFFTYKKKTDAEIETGIYPLFDYLDINLKTFFGSLNPNVFIMVGTKFWKEIETIIKEILIPLLSDMSSNLKLLDIDKLEIIYKWFKVMRNFFFLEI